MNSPPSRNKGKADAQLLGYKLARTTFYQRSLLHMLFKKYNVTITNEQWVVLKIVAATPGLSQTEIARHSLKDKTNITRILDLLAKNSLIVRQRSATDRRRFEIQLTARGESALETVTPAVAEGESILQNALTPDEVEQLKRLLDKVRDGVSAIL